MEVSKRRENGFPAVHVKQSKSMYRIAQRQRLLMMAAGACLIFFTGYTHIWSLYQPYVEAEFGWTQGQSSMSFYIANGMFVLGNIVGGRIQDKKDPRISILAGGFVFAAGVILSSFLIAPNPLPFYLSFGIMQGIGMGMIYTTIISTAQKWYPERPGFGSGIVVTANGLCGLFLTPVSKLLLNKGGVPFALLVIGIGITAAWILNCFLFSTPRKQTSEETVQGIAAQRQYTPAEMMKTRKFYFLVGAMLCGLIPYYLLVPIAEGFQMEAGVSEAVAVSAVMAGSVCNALMRLILPTLADKIGRIKCVKAVLAAMFLAMVILGFAGSYPVALAVVVMYACYGGLMGSFPSIASSIFGMKHSGENYGYIMSGMVIATIGTPALSGAFTAAGLGNQTVFLAGAVLAAVALISISKLNREF